MAAPATWSRKEYDQCTPLTWAQGGANAGHTIYDENGTKYKLHLIPSGVLNKNAHNVVGNGVVVHLPSMFEELETLAGQGVDIEGRLLLSDRAHLLFDLHKVTCLTAGAQPRPSALERPLLHSSAAAHASTCGAAGAGRPARGGAGREADRDDQARHWARVREQGYAQRAARRRPARHGHLCRQAACAGARRRAAL